MVGTQMRFREDIGCCQKSLKKVRGMEGLLEDKWRSEIFRS